MSYSYLIFHIVFMPSAIHDMFNFMLRSLNVTIPNWLSASRFFMAPFICLAILTNAWALATSLYLLAIITDFLDGWLARKLASVSATGGLLDHSADAFLVAAVLGTLSYLQLIPWLLPVFLLMAFTQYVLDSNALQGKTLKTSQLGRYNGIGYYLLAAIPLVQNSADWILFSAPSIYYLGWGLFLTTLISMLDRAVLLWRSVK